MPETKWKVEYNVEALFEREEFVGLFKREDDPVWDDFTKWAVCQRDSAKELSKIGAVSRSLRARAVLASILPAAYLPFTWEDSEKENKRAFPAWYHGSISEELQRLRYEAFCGFMEALPKSVEFDLSDHPVTEHLTRLNTAILTGSLLPSGEERRGNWKWLDLERVFRCYRLQNPGFNRERLPFASFETFVVWADKAHHDVYRRKVNARMVEMVRRDIAGDSDCRGALTAYRELTLRWCNFDTETSSSPYSEELAMTLFESYLHLPLPWEEGTHGLIFWAYLTYTRFVATDILVREGRRYLTGPTSLIQTDESHRSHWDFVARLARTLLERVRDKQLVAITREIVAEDDELQHQEAARKAEKEERESRRLAAKQAATLRLFERMREQPK